MMIEEYESGRITVDGTTYQKDLKIIGNRVVPDWWRRRGHQCDVDDVQDVLSAQPDVLVLGTGYASNMRVQESLRSALEEQNIKLIAGDTYRAVDVFNELVSKNKDVAGAFHLTC
jgi:hypothetical protein